MNEYRHYCPAALALEVVGEKWALLIVRDLLYGPRRFSDLLRSVGGITPKWLTQRLRDLEAAGIVARDEPPDRRDKREVWYRLTPKGEDLREVVRGLSRWGLRHARPPQRGETIEAERAAVVTATAFNLWGVHLPRPAVWGFQFGGAPVGAIAYDGATWTYRRIPPDGTSPDIEIVATPERWVTFLTVSDMDLADQLAEIRVLGEPDRVAEFTAALAAAGPGRPNANVEAVSGEPRIEIRSRTPE